ncbi:Nif11-like leader peptide family RiPP precursor [Nisaea denitrificans]|uniref:Nif11-like leader peptide family RiPP precursor n=1 Tax=Nisaea denitrificans TaxID=390877 RepID=UPI00041032F0|nr:Nif11-like leader peptide family RiPP precursor [Nisaea denitrificans]
MSMQTMTAFLEKAQADEKVGEQLVAIIDENEAEAIFPKVVALANDNGFSVTVDDVKEVQKQFEQAPASADGELSDDDLENVSGGVAPVVVAALITGGATLGAGGLGVGAAGVGAAGGITAAVINRGINKTASDVGNFFKKW